MKQEIKQYTGCYAASPGGEPDILIRLEITTCPNINQIVDIVSVHGQNKKTLKSIGLSLKQVVELRDGLQEVIDNSPSIFTNKKEHNPFI